MVKHISLLICKGLNVYSKDLSFQNFLFGLNECKTQAGGVQKWDETEAYESLRSVVLKACLIVYRQAAKGTINLVKLEGLSC